MMMCGFVCGFHSMLRVGCDGANRTVSWSTLLMYAMWILVTRVKNSWPCLEMAVKRPWPELGGQFLLESPLT